MLSLWLLVMMIVVTYYKNANITMYGTVMLYPQNYCEVRDRDSVYDVC